MLHIKRTQFQWKTRFLTNFPKRVLVCGALIDDNRGGELVDQTGVLDPSVDATVPELTPRRSPAVLDQPIGEPGDRVRPVADQ